MRKVLFAFVLMGWVVRSLTDEPGPQRPDRTS
jgi:hypothetical protein